MAAITIFSNYDLVSVRKGTEEPLYTMYLLYAIHHPGHLDQILV